jgi:DNA modification methylase
VDRAIQAEFTEPWSRESKFEFAPRDQRYNHNIFRYPAKFHPPIARALIERFSAPGEAVLDPFCGSGTLLVEGMLAGRIVVGTDVDPLAVFVSYAKTRKYGIDALTSRAAQIISVLERMRDADCDWFGDFYKDISKRAYKQALPEVEAWVPTIPNVEHWFRRRVILQLARIAKELRRRCKSEDERLFFTLCLAAIIRNASNADPVPVSGLEVTHHMKVREEAGRAIDPYGLLMSSITKGIRATATFVCALPRSSLHANVHRMDARLLEPATTGFVDAVITSPPYLSAVDYYRRHQLEMYWLGLVTSQPDRLRLLPQYIGRHGVSAGQLKDMVTPVRSRLARHWLRHLEEKTPERARTLRHYAVSMARALDSMLEVTRPGGKVIIVIGDSRIQEEIFPTGKLIQELAPHRLELSDVLWYPLENRYMSYKRRNGANIKLERVLVFNRK